ncbi:NAD-dependent epimerase/dehydratase family protein [Pseudonocardia saturnea]
MLVTGGSGFLGGHMVRRLAETGYQVDAVDIVAPTVSPSAKFVQADVLQWLPSSRAQYDAIFHFAANVEGRIAIENDLLGIAGNVALDNAVFSHALRIGCTVVYMSSSAVYPISRQTASGASPLQEHEVDVRHGPLGIPDLTYGWGKLSGEFMAALLADRGVLRTAIYRPFSVYGPDQAPTYPMRAIVERALRRADPLAVWGPGTQCRDFVFIDDFVSVVMETFESPDATFPLNVSTGVGTSFDSIAMLAADAVGYRPKIRQSPEKPSGVAWRVGAIDRIPTALRPRVSVQEGVERMVAALMRSRG